MKRSLRILNRANGFRPGFTASQTPGSWYRIDNKAGADAAEILLYDEIGLWGVSAGDFVRDLQAIKAKAIDLRLNTPGGEVFDGLAIYGALCRHAATVTVHVDGLAASIASVIAMAGDRILVDRYAQMMIHEAHTFAGGDAGALHAMGDLLDEYSGNIADIYAQRAGGTVAGWRERMRAETWYSADEAVAAGLADEVSGSAADPRRQMAARWDLSMFGYAGRERAPAPVAEAPATPVGVPADVPAETPPTEPAPPETPVEPSPADPPVEPVDKPDEDEKPEPEQPADDWSNLVETLTNTPSDDDEFAALVEAL